MSESFSGGECGAGAGSREGTSDKWPLNLDDKSLRAEIDSSNPEFVSVGVLGELGTEIAFAIFSTRVSVTFHLPGGCQ